MSWKSYGVVLGGSTLLSLCCILTIQILWCHWKHPFLLNDGNVLSCTAGKSHRGEYVYEYEEETVSDSAESDHEKKKKARCWKLVKRVDAMRDADMEFFSVVYVSCHFFFASSNNWSFCFCILTNQCPCQHCGGIDWLAVVQSDYCF